MQREIEKRAWLYGIAAVLIATVMVSLCYQFGYVPQIQIKLPNNPFMSTFSSFEALHNFLSTNTQNQYSTSYYTRADGGFALFGGVTPFTSLQPGVAITNSLGSADLAHSGTNVQVAGVDEADTVKVDDNGYIYLLTGNEVRIIKAYPAEEAQITADVNITEFQPFGIFVNGDRLAVIGSNYTMTPLPYNNPSIAPGIWSGSNPPMPMYLQDSKAYVKVYDISNKMNPELVNTYSVDGAYIGSRMIGNYIYLIASQLSYYKYEVLPGITADVINLPTIASGGNEKTVTFADVYYSNITDNYFTFTTVAALNIENTAEQPTFKTLLIGGTSMLYASLDNIYITQSVYGNTGYYPQTSILRVHVENSTITPEAQGTVPGSIMNQFSMDQFGDYFRVVTTTWGVFIASAPYSNASGSTVISIPATGQATNVYVLNMNMSIVGRLENISQGENFHSARFIDNRCYLVTFMKTDPLFVIDLTDPAKPTQLGNLTIPGYSDYLHPYDENHIIGVGKETEASDSGYFAWYQGVKISLFDVSNVSNPVQISQYVIGDRGTTTPVLDNHLAFLFDKANSLLVIPVLEAKINQTMYPPDQVPASAYGEPVWQGAYVFNLTVSGGFQLKGKITHMDSTTSIYDQDYYVQRSLYIENALYTISNVKVLANNLTDLSPIKEIDLN